MKKKNLTKSALATILAAGIVLPNGVAFANLQGDAIVNKDTTYNTAGFNSVKEANSASLQASQLIMKDWQLNHIWSNAEVTINNPAFFMIPKGTSRQIYNRITKKWDNVSANPNEIMIDIDKAGIPVNTTKTFENPISVTARRAAITPEGKEVDVTVNFNKVHLGWVTRDVTENATDGDPGALILRRGEVALPTNGAFRFLSLLPNLMMMESGYVVQGDVFPTNHERKMTGLESEVTVTLTYADTGKPFTGEWKLRFDDVDQPDGIKTYLNRYQDPSVGYQQDQIDWKESVSILSSGIDVTLLNDDGPSLLRTTDNNTFSGSASSNNKQSSAIASIDGDRLDYVGRVSSIAGFGLVNIAEAKSSLLITVQEDNKPVADMTYEVFNQAGTKVGNWTTNEEGRAFLDRFTLDAGTYTVKGTHRISGQTFEQPVTIPVNSLGELHLKYFTEKTPVDFGVEERENPELLLDEKVKVQEGVPGEDVVSRGTIQVGPNGEPVEFDIPREDTPAVPEIWEFGTKPFYTHFINKKTDEPLTEKELREQPAREFDKFDFVETKKDGDDIYHYYVPNVAKFIVPTNPKNPIDPTDPTTFKEIIPQTGDNIGEPKEIPGYRFVETNELPNGDFEHVYEEVITRHQDEEGNELIPQENGLKDPQEIDNYKLVETKDEPNGDRTHVYRKVNTFFKDEEGNELIPNKEGNNPKEDIPGYKFIETKEEPNGDVTHIYKKVFTNFVDEGGKEIVPNEPGLKEPKDLEGYTLIETKEDEEGNRTHVYKQNKTFFKDRDGNDVLPKEVGLKDKKEVGGYRHIETKELPNGDRVHVYEKVQTFFRDENGKEIVPPVMGTEGPKNLNGYEFVRTTTENGDTVHIYRMIPKQSVVKPVVNTGATTSVGAGIAGLLSSLAGLFAFRKKNK